MNRIEGQLGESYVAGLRAGLGERQRLASAASDASTRPTCMSMSERLTSSAARDVEEGCRARGPSEPTCSSAPAPASSRKNGAHMRRARPRSGRRRSGDRASLGGCPCWRRTRRGPPVAALRTGPDSSPADDRGTSGRAGRVLGSLAGLVKSLPPYSRKSRAGRTARRRRSSADSGRGVLEFVQVCSWPPRRPPE